MLVLHSLGTSRTHCRLVQSGRLWNEKLNKILEDLGFVRSTVDFSIYIRKSDGVALAIYCDDTLISAPTKDAIKHFKDELSKTDLKFTSPDDFNEILGVAVDRRADGSIHFHQAHYVQRMLDDFGFADCDPNGKANTPWVKSVSYAEGGERTTLPYSSLLGRLLWLANTSRPDIAWAVGKASRRAHMPTDMCYSRLKRICAYLKGTITRGIIFRAGDAEGWERIMVFTDSDWAGDVTRRSCSGVLVFYNGCPIAWHSKMQTICGRSVTAVSSGEAEFYAFANGVKYGLGFRSIMKLFDDLEADTPTAHIMQDTKATAVADYPVWKSHDRAPDGSVSGPATSVASDSTVALHMAKNPTTFKSRHMDIRVQFVRDAVDYQQVVPKKVDTNWQPADLMTKAVTGAQHRRLYPILSGTGQCPTTHDIFK